MTERDILIPLKEQLRAELGREANETIEKLVHKFRCELGKHKTTLIAEMLKNVEIVANRNGSGEITFQINITSTKEGADNG